MLRVPTYGRCEIPIPLNSKTYLITWYMFFLLRNVDIILEVSWFTTLGEVKTNWAQITIQIDRDRCHQFLQGEPSLFRWEVQQHQLQSLSTDDYCWWLWAMMGESNDGQFVFVDDLTIEV